MTFNEEDMSQLLRAVKFSAEKHKSQRRKGAEGSPYINHPIAVAETIWTVGGIRDLSVILAKNTKKSTSDDTTKKKKIALRWSR